MYSHSRVTSQTVQSLCCRETACPCFTCLVDFNVIIINQSLQATSPSILQPPMAASNRDKVILHQFNRQGGLPSLSPPCLKLETYLRMTKIPYECVFSLKKSSKGKMPWIEYNGQEIADSNFCIEFLNKEFGVDVDDHLTIEQKGMARAILVMLEENTYW